VTDRLRTAGIVLAAGGARRFGAPKQLAPLDGRPLLAHAVAAACATPELERVVVVLGAHAADVRAAAGLGAGASGAGAGAVRAGAAELGAVRASVAAGVARAEVVVADDWEDGLSASLRAGLAAVGEEVDAVAVLLGDNPLLDAATIGRVVRARGAAAAARAVHAGRPGHPVVLGRALFPALRALRGDEGAGRLLRAVDVVTVDCSSACVADVDTPAQLAALGG
jgi:CTP:molybdopterin cytidylyltransferase MocA